MKKSQKPDKVKLLNFNRPIRNALLKGEMISGVVRKHNGDLMAKYTKTVINNTRYYGIWEKDLLEGKWHLLHYGKKEDVESEWKNFADFWKRQGDRISTGIA
ncbi:MAG: hypothetical protein GX876_03035 [Bacteroidales bacterium]|nr:hypothetical protein [Bacteroidales bacterium]